MKYKVLLAGSHQASIEDLFTRTEESFTCITSSMRELDLARHMELFHPDLFILCLQNETEAIIDSMVEVKKECEKYNTSFVILGDEKECKEFKQRARYVADLVLETPITTTHILEKIGFYLEERVRIEREVLEEDRKRRESQGMEAVEPTGIFAKEELVPPPPEPEPPAPKRHVLVVDDDANMLKLIKRYLEDTYDVATALNGKLAVRFLSKKHTDLILLDYEMPEGSGDEVLAAVRNFEKTKDIPVLFLTGVSDPKKIKKVLAFKPQGYLLKPIDQQELLKAVKEQIG